MTGHAGPVARLSVMLLIAAVVAGCGVVPVSPPLSPPTLRTIGPTTRVPPYAGAPTVRDPLPSTVLSGHPCTTALTPAQVKEVLGSEATGERDRGESRGPACLWDNPVTGRAIRVAYATTYRHGLSAVYPSRSPDEGWVWRELTVAGFPAVATTPDPQTYCTVTVGLADDVAVEISMVGRPGEDDVCVAAGQIAELVVATLRKRAGR